MKWRILLSIILLVLISGLILFEVVSNPSSEDRDVFVVNRGDNILKVSSGLKADGYIQSKILFILSSFNEERFKKIKAGRYELVSGASNEEILRILMKSGNIPVEFTVAPGYSIKEIGRVLERAGVCKAKEFMEVANDEGKWRALQEHYDFLKDIPLGSNIEGYLFPDTYMIDKGVDSIKVIEMMLDNFKNKVSDIDMGKKGKNMHEIVIMASMVEKEVASLEDKRMVAGLLWKRLDSGYPLEVDSTLLYYLASEHPDVNDKNVDSAYNTYRYRGLPKGPISNPSLETIESIIRFQESDYWFYLSSSDGRTIFSKTYGEHLINKAKYLDK